MIKLKLVSGEEHIVTPTVFPDGTSQVWKLPESFLPSIYYPRLTYNLVWYFESEAEIIQLVQLRYLLGTPKFMFIPFLPYSRQDKTATNESTFALKPFLDLLLDTFAGTSITTLDVHNKEAFQLKNSIDSLSPAKYILKSLIHSQADLVCYPDAGAQARYNHLIPMDHVIADKVRDQATGQITGHTLQDTKHDLNGKTVLIVDDLCDGGKTFTSMTKMLKEAGAKNVDLYVTHGVFSQGIHVLHIAGIRKIYSTDSYKITYDRVQIFGQSYDITYYKVEE